MYSLYKKILCKRMNYILESTAISKIIWFCSFSVILNTQSSSNNNSTKQINILSGKTTIYWKKTFQYHEKHKYSIHFIFLSYFIHFKHTTCARVRSGLLQMGKNTGRIIFHQSTDTTLKQLRYFKLNSSLHNI